MFRAHPFGPRADIGPFSLLLNVLWLVLGGALLAFGWFVAALVMCVTIIGIPWARAAFDNGLYALWPFGVRAMDRARVSGPDIGTSLFGFIGNVLWLIFAGWWLALGHLLAALVAGITIIGLPFAWAHLKLAGYALWPIGRALVSDDFARGRF
ncbi:MAG: YccF domain-containing protein [Parvularculaceae bacterium]|nr:YccF domain-containing protein [Parvularculaceae bacterium]